MGTKLAGRSEYNSSAGGEKKDKVLTVVLTIILIFMSSLIIVNPSSVAPRPRGSQPQIEYLAITTIIDNNYAVTNIQEKFTNPYSYPIDETFQFQIPAKAFISNFSLTVNNEIHYSQIVPSSVGKEKYENAVISGSDAGLVEEKDKNIFSYSVSLSPNSETIVGLRYEQFLEKSLGGYEYKIPLKGSDVGSNIEKFSIGVTIKSNLLVTDLDVEGYRDNANLTVISSYERKVTYLSSSSTPTQDFIINYKLAAPPVNGTMLNYNDGTEEYFF
ncbi:MAG: hypothetical protein KAJ51_05870, partial [Thermoplasmata archaeon]|nr:hypothetical protein [Thermoplasmata archaeon]